MPNYFENISGQDSVCKILQSQIDSDKISHAYLFSGPAGCGKLACAKAFAKSLEGEKFSHKIDNNTCVDVKIFKPQGVNGYLIGQIKEIVKDSNLAPILAKYKIYIIQDAEKLNTSSANAFLKTLEEPCENVCFILLANNQDNVLSTIVSRCQILQFKSLAFSEALSFVQKESGASIDDANKALTLYGGNTTLAIEFCLNQNLIDLYSEVINILENFESMTDWQCLERSLDLGTKVKEIVEVYKDKLNEDTKDLTDVLEGPAISLLEEQNKRFLSAKQKDLLLLIISSIKLYLRYLLDSANDADVICTLNVLSKFEANLSYNISLQNFLDVVLLSVKYKGKINYDKNSFC